ncbi:hypothetical protein W02_29370 [Nitrospira sp. KM1]|uniref:hypothetical protein n=1 Tax=Nitrospira sp. KM1 TaxID=1936990 RepID=UPI0013A795C7|nr:hypothetical protein [Nitrospira sp. KM1]BCA55797.1 hypothetical protein W02_29370 [Nitrospira sp. KM1]
MRFAAPGAGIKLNPPVTFDNEVVEYQVTSDSRAVVYAFANRHLYWKKFLRRTFDQPGEGIDLNLPLEADQYLVGYKLMPDASGVVMLIGNGNHSKLYLKTIYTSVRQYSVDAGVHGIDFRLCGCIRRNPRGLCE